MIWLLPIPLTGIQEDSKSSTLHHIHNGSKKSPVLSRRNGAAWHFRDTVCVHHKPSQIHHFCEILYMVTGWCDHPVSTAAELTLRYNQHPIHQNDDCLWHCFQSQSNILVGLKILTLSQTSDSTHRSVTLYFLASLSVNCLRIFRDN